MPYSLAVCAHAHRPEWQHLGGRGVRSRRIRDAPSTEGYDASTALELERFPARFATTACWLAAASKRRHDWSKLNVGGSSAKYIELAGVKEHHTALAAGEELSLVPATVFSHHTYAMIALEGADSAAPHAARNRNGCGHGEIVVIPLRRCPFSSPAQEILYGGKEIPGLRDALLLGMQSPSINRRPRCGEAPFLPFRSGAHCEHFSTSSLWT